MGVMVRWAVPDGGSNPSASTHRSLFIDFFNFQYRLRTFRVPNERLFYNDKLFPPRLWYHERAMSLWNNGEYVSFLSLRVYPIWKWGFVLN